MDLTSRHEARQLPKPAVVGERWTSQSAAGSRVQHFKRDVLREMWVCFPRRCGFQEAHDRAYGDEVLLLLLQQRLIQRGGVERSPEATHCKVPLQMPSLWTGIYEEAVPCEAH